MDRGADRSQFVGVSIGIVAREIGIHPQTIRDYERKGLINPLRTPGGSRRYREAEFAQLRRIQQLTDLGLSLAGVEHVLSLESQLSAFMEYAQDLERRLSRHEPVVSRMPSARDSPAGQGTGTTGSEVVRRSVSVEIVHVPRRPRGVRWSNTRGS